MRHSRTALRSRIDLYSSEIVDPRKRSHHQGPGANVYIIERDRKSYRDQFKAQQFTLDRIAFPIAKAELFDATYHRLNERQARVSERMFREWQM